MTHSFVRIAFAILSLLLSAVAQNADTAAATATTQPATSTPLVAAQVPRLVKFTGAVQNPNQADAGSGVTARDSASVPTDVVGITFSLYSQQTGGVPLWSEVQNVHVDSAGHYTVKLGASKPDRLPVEVFTSAEAQWLGIRQEGQAEQPRIMLMSVPYALKAADAETFGGKPPSAYMSAPTSRAGSTGAGTTPATNGKQSPQPTVGGTGTANYIAMWTSASNLGSSALYEGSNHYLGIGTTAPNYPLNIDEDTLHPALYVLQSGATGTGVMGNASSRTGKNIGVWGTTRSTTGTGVFGQATSTTGENIGVSGTSASNEGTGVDGTATATTGTTWGVHGESASAEGNGVIGEATSTTGTASGVVGNSASPDGVGVSANASSETGNTYGVYGTAESPSGVGVGGTANAATGFAVGVYGVSGSTSGVGVVGKATSETGASAFGVKGVTDSDAGVGVYGVADTDTGNNIGVQGTAESPDSGAVAGYNTGTTGSAFGVVASTASMAGIGMYSVAVEPSVTTTDERPVGIWGTTNVSGGIGIGGTADDGYAVGGANYSSDHATARFQNQIDDESAPVFIAIGTATEKYCWVDVNGDMLCSGAIIGGEKVENGTRTVSLYAVEAAENWFEDAGSARLANGSAVVQLESTFAQTVDTGVEYHVFLTPKGDCKGLYVTNESADSFEVRELGGGTANIAFDYRIMARRKGYENVRLADRTERVARLLALNSKQVPQRKPPKLPGKVSATASLVPRPPLMRAINAVPNVQRPNPAVQKPPSKLHN